MNTSAIDLETVNNDSLTVTDTISVILPCLNESRYIDKCVQSVINSIYDKDYMELIIVDGGSTDNTVELIKKYTDQYPYIKLLHNPAKIAPVAMNIGIKAAKGDYIIRIDAHSSYGKEYFSKLIEWHHRLKADNVGGLWITEVLNKTPKSLSIKEVLTNKWGVGDSIFRLGIDSVQEVDTVPFGCYHKDTFKRHGLYNEKLARNQDIELNKRIKQQGGKIFLIPEISCTYYARETWSKLAKNNFGNGLWNVLTPHYTKNSGALSLRHFIPLIFLLSLIIPTIAGIFYTPFFLVGLASLVAYSGLLLSESVRISVAKKLPVHLVFATFFVLHFSYGWGSLVGIFRVIRLKLTRQ